MRIKGLCFSYINFRIFDDFELYSNAKVIFIRGPNGCGKTTLLKLISGNLQPDSFVEMPDNGYSCLILQEDALFPWLTGEENILRILKIPHSGKRLINEHPMFEYVKPFINKYAFEMSYGQRRLLELMRAIIFKPKLLCLDEPFNFLDNNSRHIASSFFSSLNLSNTTMIIATHYKDDLEAIESYKDLEHYVFNGNFPIRQLERQL